LPDELAIIFGIDKGTSIAMRSIRLDELTFVEAGALARNPAKRYGVLLPLGCTEQHGPNLPLGCDTAIARGAAEGLARALIRHPRYGAVVMPDLAYTPSPGAEDFAGTVSVSFEWMGNGIKEILAAAIKTPWAFIGIINAHGHNHGRVIEASMAGAQALLGRRVPVVVINVYDYTARTCSIGINPGSHAGEYEIALYHYYVGLTVPENNEQPSFQQRQRPPNIFGLDLVRRSHRGVISDPAPEHARALEKSRELGELIDRTLLDTLESNLDIYFSEWDSRGDTPEYV
jgi:creatinine amidohydrolase/Fe(II)-dependent formamide hydrolase-like protein